MAVVKNKTTERGREFWSHVESIASQVRNSERIDLKLSNADGSCNEVDDTQGENLRNHLIDVGRIRGSSNR